jgi:hypothetical protein
MDMDGSDDISAEAISINEEVQKPLQSIHAAIHAANTDVRNLLELQSIQTNRYVESISGYRENLTTQMWRVNRTDRSF